ncbi:hypothetical protein ACE6H2_016199 [Prunus campanulata]
MYAGNQKTPYSSTLGAKTKLKRKLKRHEARESNVQVEEEDPSSRDFCVKSVEELSKRDLVALNNL